MKKVSIIISLCSIQFYLAMQTVGQTEASFSSRASSEQVISAAIVFPKTIQQLVIAAKDHSTKANHLYESILKTSPIGTDSEMSKLLTNVLNEEHELNDEIKSLHRIQEQMNSYHKQVHELQEVDRNSYEYERKGYEVMNQLILQVNESINLEKIDKIKADIQLNLNEGNEEKKANIDDSQNNAQNNTTSQTNLESDQNEGNEKKKDGIGDSRNNTENINAPHPDVESVQNEGNEKKKDGIGISRNNTENINASHTDVESVQNETSDNSNNTSQNE
ncbi:hypothetical protein CN692_15755 [Bacillus sp. AFS002410]|uniref:DUF4047 domain-containing protein n=1 Tax=Bacillus sp. AFS002410 TaxID=2033481 RepID=UPI000BF03A3D|nr:DUF4047 domain-containing protein [Bacillus sp. AFS002410]PEJ56789.1 hypothetical protein CN692_15755 [Bacillus sp. AFS002410]